MKLENSSTSPNLAKETRDNFFKNYGDFMCMIAQLCGAHNIELNYKITYFGYLNLIRLF